MTTTVGTMVRPAGGRRPKLRTCTCGNQWREASPSGKAAKTCPECRIATGRGEWRACESCGQSFVASVQHDSRRCRQCYYYHRRGKPAVPGERLEPFDLPAEEIERMLDAADKRSWRFVPHWQIEGET